jgi:NADH-quinone oxidoreductase subunit E
MVRRFKMAVDTPKLERVLKKYEGEDGLLIQALLEVQREFNWIPGDGIRTIAKTLNVPPSRVYRIASYYKAMSLKPRGKHIVRVCLGTACHVRGGPRIMDMVQTVLDLKDGDTTPDMNFTVERVNCLGCCALGPVLVVDGVYFGKMEPNKVSDLLNKYR